MYLPDGHKPCLAPVTDFAELEFEVPDGACDTHAHIIGDGVNHPFVESRSYTPPPATEGDYFAMLAACGMSRGVLVQVSVHGTDNRYMLNALRDHPQSLRGVVVVDSTITDAELQDMHEAGVRGVRFNVLFGGGVGFNELEHICKRIAPLGWHAQFLMDVRQLPEMFPRMRDLKVPCVIDHMGHMPVSEGIEHQGFQLLCKGIREYGWWTKLSGAFRISEQFDSFEDVAPWARALIAAAPDRVVWGSDWPHVAVPQMPDPVKLLNLLWRWVPDDALRRRILVENPAALYGF